MLGREFWAKYFRVYDVLNTVPTYRELLDSICRELAPQPGTLVLDAGSGTGNLALRLKGLGCEVVAIDFCEQAVECHTAKGSGGCVLVGDLTNGLPFRDDCFDGIVCNNVLYTLSARDQLKAAKEFHRVLKPGGRVALANPKAGWKPMAIYLRSIAYGIRDEGRWVTAKEVAKGIVPTVKMFYYNGRLRKEKEYHYFEFGEQRTLLEAGGFFGVSDTALVYADQVVLNSAHKGVAESAGDGPTTRERITVLEQMELPGVGRRLPLMLFPQAGQDGDAEVAEDGGGSVPSSSSS
jgi:ubiquinone/menaquinone biosynthesis C-methylase UbiE